VGRRLALLLLAAALLVLPGCFYAPLYGVGSASSDEAAAEANVRASIPAIEAYYVDHGTYAGATLANLRIHYDAGLPDVRIVGPLNSFTYCVESTVGSATYSKAGPRAEIVPVPCGSLAQGSVTVEAPPPVTVHTDAEEAVLAAVPLLEAYHADHGSYAGVEKVSRLYGVPLDAVRVVVRKDGRAYCVEAPAGAPSAHFDGPQGPLSPGPCGWLSPARLQP
jgi:hypothetical protein